MLYKSCLLGARSAHLVRVIGLDVGALAEAVRSLISELVVLAADKDADVEGLEANLLVTNGISELLVSVTSEGLPGKDRS